MSIRKFTIWALALVIGLPIALAVAAWVGFYALLSSVAPNRTNGSVVSSGEEREYLLYVPKSYDRAKPAPLVISMHAAMNWPAFQMEVTGWNKLADEHGFIVVYPAGTGVGPRIWSMDGARNPPRMPDVVFISELIDRLKSEYNVDPARIYADGLSNGGGMAFALSCTLSDRIAAVGMVSSAQLLPSKWCKDTRPVPMIMFHGTADPVIPYKGGSSPVTPAQQVFPSVPAFTADWARRNRCDPDPVESAVAADVTRVEYKGCAGEGAVVLYTFNGGGHQWFGGMRLPERWVGPMSNSIDTTREEWKFFSAHRLAAK
jgi:polyhydroxybutyrate depolymerase